MANSLTYPSSKAWKARAAEIISAVLLFPLLLIYRRRKLTEKFKILFIEPFGFGDVVSLSAAFDPILAEFPEAEIHILTQPRNGEVFQRDTRVHKTHVAPIPWAGHYHEKRMNFAALRETMKVATALRKLDIDVAIDPRGDFRSQLVMLICGCRVRAGFTNYLVNSNIEIRGLLLNKKYGRMENIHRFEINRQLAEFALDSKLPSLSIPCFKPGEERGERIVVHPFGGWEGKLWPAERWFELLREFPLHDIVLCGTSSEEPALVSLSAELDCEHRVTSVADLVDLLVEARLFIGLDSGPMNLAAAMGVPVVALFGPGDSKRWKPLSKGSHYVHHVLACAPCVQNVCCRPEDSCMSQISVSEVRAAVNEVLGDE